MSIQSLLPQKDTIAQFSKFVLVGILNTAHFSGSILSALQPVCCRLYHIESDKLHRRCDKQFFLEQIVGIPSWYPPNDTRKLGLSAGLCRELRHTIPSAPCPGRTPQHRPQLGSASGHGRLYDCQLPVEPLLHLQKITAT